MNKILILLLGAMACSVTALTQPDLPPPGEVFVDTLVPRIDITVDPDTLAWLYENVESNQEFHATFSFDNGHITETVENVGFRLRGNTSRFSAKKSFKVSFNTFDPGRQWHGLEKLNLNGEHNDPSVIRSKLCWDLLYELGIAGSRSNHVELYINGNFHGLYINVEHIDEEFVLSRFGNNDGNLYKCLWPADLNYLGSNPDNYKLLAGDRRVYDLKTNTGQDDYSDLAHFIDILNNAPDEDFLCEIEKVFNIYDYIKILAFDVITSNWDGYIFNQNNFYLYRNTATGKFEYISYDLDNTFGIDWFDITWAIRDPYSWHSGMRPLYSRIMDTPELRALYTHYLEHISEVLLEPAAYSAHVETVKWRNAPFVQSDPFYPLDYGFTYTDYLDSYNQPLGMHVKAGIYPYLDDRRESLQQQLENTTPGPVVNHIRNNHPQAGEVFKVRASAGCLDAGAQVVVSYSVDGGPLTEAEMFDDGEHWDRDAGDGIYGCLVTVMELNMSVSYQVTASTMGGMSSVMPCAPLTYQLLPSTDAALSINEFMASNAGTVADEFGEFDDWIEVFNGDETAVWLGDKYLTDNLDNQNKWLMPDITLEPGEFVLFWADDDPEQGPYHTNFKLDAEGEEIGIFDSESTGFFLLDSVSFAEQETDVSMGRKPDGEDTWVYFTNTTPGYSNLLGDAGGLPGNASLLLIYPNPVTGGTMHFGEKTSFTLFSILGNPVMEAADVVSVNLDGLSPGVYLVVTTRGEYARILVQ